MLGHSLSKVKSPFNGKGEHDGASVVIKRMLTQEELKPDGWPMKCAADVVNFLKFKFQPTGEAHRCSTRRVFWLVSINDVHHGVLWDCQCIADSCSFHCVDGYSTSDPCTMHF